MVHLGPRHDPDLHAGELEDFVHFVMVRTYLLLEHGPDVSVWQLGQDGVWRASCVASAGTSTTWPRSSPDARPAPAR